MRRFLFFAFFAFLAFQTAADEASLGGRSEHDVVVGFFESFQAACERDGGALWGISLCGPVLVYDKDKGIAYGNGPDGAGVLKGHDTYWRGNVSSENAPPYSNTAAEWSGVRWAVLRIEDLDKPDSAVRLALHESFHRIQPDLGHGGADPGDLPSHLDTEHGRTLLRGEMRALRAALEAATTEEKKAVRRHLRNAGGLRAVRYGLFDGAAEKERALEVHEGLAEYTGWRAAEVDLDFSAVAAQLEEKESEKSYMRSFPYWTGPAYGLLFDYLQADWRERFKEPEASFLSVAQETAGKAKLAEDQTYDDLASAFPEYGLKEIYAEEAAYARELSARKADYVARFVEGRRLVVPLFQIAFNPQTVMSLGDFGQVYGTLSTHGPWGTISTESGALVVWKERKIYFDRRDLEGAPPWTTDVWTLSLNEGWSLYDDGRDVVVQQDEP